MIRVEEIAGLVPEIPLEYDQIMKGGGKFWDDVNGGYLLEDLVLAARREEIDSSTLRRCLRDCSKCKSARMRT